MFLCQCVGYKKNMRSPLKCKIEKKRQKVINVWPQGLRQNQFLKKICASKQSGVRKDRIRGQDLMWF